MASRATTATRLACAALVGVVGAAAYVAKPAAAASGIGPGQVTVVPLTAQAGSTGNAFTFTYKAPSSEAVIGCTAGVDAPGLHDAAGRNSALPGFVAIAGGTCPAASWGRRERRSRSECSAGKGTVRRHFVRRAGIEGHSPQRAGQYAFETSIVVGLSRLSLPSRG